MLLLRIRRRAAVGDLRDPGCPVSGTAPRPHPLSRLPEAFVHRSGQSTAWVSRLERAEPGRPPVALNSHQNCKRSAICRIRGSSALVMRPNWAEERFAFGCVKFTLLNALKNSTRNWAFSDSRI